MIRWSDAQDKIRRELTHFIWSIHPDGQGVSAISKHPEIGELILDLKEIYERRYHFLLEVYQLENKEICCFRLMNLSDKVQLVLFLTNDILQHTEMISKIWPNLTPLISRSLARKISSLEVPSALDWNLDLKLASDVKINLQIGESTIKGFTCQLSSRLRFDEEVTKNGVFYLWSHHRDLGISNNLIFGDLTARTIEALWKIDILPREEALRVVFLELSRIHGHLESLENFFHKKELWVFAKIFSDQKARVKDFFTSAQTSLKRDQIICPQGILGLLPQHFYYNLNRDLEKIISDIKDVWRLIKKSPNFIDYSKQGGLSPDVLINYGASGPLLRCSGINFDSRKFFPYYLYEELDFEVPLGVSGTFYDLIMVLIHEMFESAKIIEQLLDHLPAYQMPKQHLYEYLKEAPIVEKGRDAIFFSPHLETANGLTFFTWMKDGICPKKFTLRSAQEANLFALLTAAQGEELSFLQDVIDIISPNLGEISR
jgi:NADH:ubiquinone oxidoreductase subunit D